MSTMMTPKEIASELDKFIIGQDDAKRAVAIALRNRWRRMQLDEDLRMEITPKNILMIGPTGVGKTEIARRLSRLANAPFIKVEATKFTEVGYVGRDVDSIIRDLADTSVKMMREDAVSKVKAKAEEAALDRILDAMLPTTKTGFAGMPIPTSDNSDTVEQRRSLRIQLINGELDNQDIEIELSSSALGVEIMAPPGMEEMTSQLQGMFQSLSGGRTKKRKMKVKEALKLAQEDEASKLVDEEDIKAKAITNVEQNGIVFIDELDKVANRQEQHRGGGDVSREGVQRDLLPLIEGCTISTRYGMIKTNHILFIASGAFHYAKPSDLIAELQGRLPIRVELNALKVEDFVRILTEPQASLTKQYTALLGTEDVKIKFTEGGIKRIAEIAWQVNERTENIGARRLHTVMERLLDDLSYTASDQNKEPVTINKSYVDEHLNALVEDEDLSQYIL